MAGRERNRLTDKEIRAATGGKLRDGGGLYLEVLESGKFWRHQFRANGVERLVSLGRYPDVSLKLARDRANAHRAAVQRGEDPVLARRAHKRAAIEANAAAQAGTLDTFGTWAQKFRAARAPSWSSTHASDVERILGELTHGNDGASGFGQVPIRDLEKRHILAVIDGAVARGARVHADDLLTYTLAVVRYFNGRQPRGRKYALDELDAPGIREAMGAAPAAKPHPRLPLQDMPRFLYRLRTESNATLRVRRATQLLLLTGVRTVELRSLEWAHIDWPNATWTVPPERMKHRRRVWAPFHVPLARQSVAILAQLRAEREMLEADDPRRQTALVFWNERDPFQTMSENTVLAHLKRLGYGGRQTGHGFRGLVSTWGNREGFNADAIERQLSHVEADKVRGAYNEWEFWPERVRLMQAWADQIDAWFLEGAQASD